MTTPMSPERAPTRLRAAWLGWKSCLATTSRTRRLVSAETLPPLRTRETVDWATSASRAICTLVTVGRRPM